jgi:hypothetical protein
MWLLDLLNGFSRILNGRGQAAKQIPGQNAAIHIN